MGDEHLEKTSKVKEIWLLLVDNDGYEWMQPATDEDLVTIITGLINDDNEGGNA